MKTSTILLISLICLTGLVGFLLFGITLLEERFVESVESGELDEFIEKNANFIFLDCLNCSRDLNNHQDCKEFLEKSYKENPIVTELVEKHDFKKITRIEKKVSTNFKDKRITCYYYKQNKIILD